MNVRCHTSQDDRVTDNVLHERRVIGQVDLFSDQAGQIVGSGVAAVRRATEIQHQIGGARRWGVAVDPVITIAKGARYIGPRQIVHTDIIQHQARAAGY